MAIFKFHQSTTWGYSKLLPGNALYHEKGIRANQSAILEKAFKMLPMGIKLKNTHFQKEDEPKNKRNDLKHEDELENKDDPS